MTDKTDREIMQMALEALEVVTDNYDDNAVGIEIDAIIALRERLAQPEQEPVADEGKLIDLLEAARETFKKSPSGSECCLCTFRA